MYNIIEGELRRKLVHRLIKKTTLEKVMDRSYFWVNQGKTFEDELECGVIFAGLEHANKMSHHELLTELNVGDVIFSHLGGGKIKAVLEVNGKCTEELRPYLGPKKKKYDNGYSVKCSYTLLNDVVDISDTYEEIIEFAKRLKFIGKNGKVRQGYLFKLSDGINEQKKIANVIYKAIKHRGTQLDPELFGC